MILVATSALNATMTLVVVPVVVAVLTAAGTLLVTRASEAANRRRDRYASAVETLVAWIEFPYRVRRRTDDQPATLAALASLGHDLQQRLSCHQAWIATDDPRLGATYATIRATVSEAVAPAVAEAWNLPPVATAADMNLGGWGPAPRCQPWVACLQRHIEHRFGWRRLTRRPTERR